MLANPRRLAIAIGAAVARGFYWLLLRKPVHQIEAYRTRNEHGQNMDQG